MQGYRYAHGDQPLDGYTIHYALGRGGFGEVYFAVSDSGREVALKAIQNYEEIELRGIGHCMNLKSSHLVTIFDVKHDADGRPWVIMEYVSGPSLAEMLDGATDSSGKRTGIGSDQAMYFTRELIKGLRYLHDAGVVHRDLKPHNIFFEDGTVKIGDYSLSKAISTSHRSSHTTTVGSVHYMAPEIGEGNYGKAVDVYALGVILFEMLTGSPPYVGESMGEVLIKHLTSQPDVASINEPFASTILKAMARKPEDRFQSVDEMLVALCPQDHSSYLPAPASLSMIGDSAERKRAKENAANQASLQAPPRSGAAGEKKVETIKALQWLVDTDDQTDSQPFERPGFAPPFGKNGLWQTLGLGWKRSNLIINSRDPINLFWRAMLSVIVSSCFVMFTFAFLNATVSLASSAKELPVSVSLSLGGLVFLALMVLLWGAFICWAFLQTLPRSDQWQWSGISRFIGAVIVLFVLMLGWAIANRVSGRRWDDIYIPVAFLFCLIVDWRCFISADRYPRVGILRTLVAVGLLTTLCMLMGAKSTYTIFLLGVGTALIVTIQILAPHVRVSKKKQEAEDPKVGQVIDLDDQIDGLAQTRGEPDSILLKEKI